MFIYSIIFAVHAALQNFLSGTDCNECTSSPFGFVLDLTNWEGCDDCLRRHLVAETIVTQSLWKLLNSGSDKSVLLANALCNESGCYLDSDLSNLFRQHNLFSKWLLPDGTNTALTKEFIKHQSRFVMKDTGIDEKGYSALSLEASFALCKQKGNFLNIDTFPELVFPFITKDLDGITCIEGLGITEHVQVKVQRWVKLGTYQKGKATVKGLISILKNMVIPELTADGKMSEVSLHSDYAALLGDDSAGISRFDEVDIELLKKEYVIDPEVYYNLMYTYDIHCGYTAAPKTFVKGKCLAHSIGYHDGCSTDVAKCPLALCRADWIPNSYGVKIPGNVLTQIKPAVNGITSYLLRLSALPVSFTLYLLAVATMITPSFVTLNPVVQSFLISKYKEASKVPGALVARLIGLSIEDACNIIFSSKSNTGPASNAGISAPADPKKHKSWADMHEEKKPPPDSTKKKKEKKKPPSDKKEQGGTPVSAPDEYKGYTAKQVKNFYTSFGGGFNAFRDLKSKHDLKGKLDLVKLANYFEKGKAKFGQKTAAEVAASCSLN